MRLTAKPSHTVEVAELLARLATAEQTARKEYEALSHDPPAQDALAGVLSGLQRAARITRELAAWPIEADSDRTSTGEETDTS